MKQFLLPRDADFFLWRDRARAALREGLAPEQIEWLCPAVSQAELFSADQDDSPLSVEPVGRVTKTCLALLQSVLRHCDPQRFALAYRLLWRAQSDPGLFALATDPDIRAAARMDHQIRRDMHKMKAFLRFREDIMAEGKPEGKRRHFLAWFEPEHHILESVAPFFAERFSDMDWMILTPIGSIVYSDEKLVCDRMACTPPELEDDVETLWHRYYQSIFNPARIKMKAMRSEMPTKYWKNLPETQLIPKMLANAERRVAVMMAQQSDGQAPVFHERNRAEWARKAEASRVQTSALSGLPALSQALTECRQCTLCHHATQVVPGVGPARALLMMIGEQPGDQEDLQGEPFVGPAGNVLDRLLKQVGIARDALYLTNAVKHFKFIPKGRRRLHQTPDYSEVVACSPWLQQEITLVQPRLIVTLGATALHALEGRGARLGATRGRIRAATAQRPPSLATVHPSYLLRLPDPQRAREEESRVAEELTMARRWLEDKASAPVG